MPKGRELPYEWYNTPNIHLFTLRDFLALCKAEGIHAEIADARASSRLGRLLLRLGFRNLGADRVVARLTPKMGDR
jgi:homoserine O-acetyltransferase